MAITLTVGTNTYISLANANTYFSTRIYSDNWTGTDDTKSMALIAATKKIDRQILKGVKSVESQTLQFPRALYVDDAYNTSIGLAIDNVHGEGWYVETAVSQNVKDACCEEALAILTAGANANKRAELQAQGVKSYSIGNLSETFTNQNISGTKLLSLEARDLLRTYMGGMPIC